MDTFNTPRIADDFFSQLIGMHRNRASFFRRLSYALLGMTAILIAVGIVSFLRGDPQTDVIAAEELQLQREIDQVRSELNSKAIGLATTRSQAVRLERGYILANCLV